MSLVAFALRIATVRAIRAAVWPSFVVAESPQQPLALIEQGRPAIAVYTGHDTDRMDGTELLAGDPKVQLAIQVFLPAQVTIAVAGADKVLDTSGEGAETLLDVIVWRILAGLVAGADPWSRLWAEFAIKVDRTRNSSYLIETGQVRTSARELTIDCEVLYEPTGGAPPAPDSPWTRLLALMEADTGGSAPLAPWIAAEIAGPRVLTQAERDRIDLGLSEYASRALGFGPIEPGVEMPIAAVTVDRADLYDGAPADPVVIAPEQVAE